MTTTADWAWLVGWLLANSAWLLEWLLGCVAGVIVALMARVIVERFWQ